MSGKVFLPDTQSVSMSARAARQLVGRGDGDAALLYIYILSNSGKLPDDPQAELKMNASRMESAIKTLTQLELIAGVSVPEVKEVKKEQPQVNEEAHYTTEDIRNEMKNGSTFSMLAKEVQKSLGKVLSSDDLMRLFGMYDGLRLPPEVILQLVNHCIDYNTKRYNGRMPTMRYIEKAAYTWEKAGIFSIEKAEQYIKDIEKKNSAYENLKHILQIKDRELTKSETEYADAWIKSGYTDKELEDAYDKTLVNTGKMAWKYMDQILRNGESKPQFYVEPKKGTVQGPTEEDMQRMKKLLDDINRG